MLLVQMWFQADVGVPLELGMSSEPPGGEVTPGQPSPAPARAHNAMGCFLSLDSGTLSQE